MKTNYQKEYIKFSVEYRNSNNSEESTSKLYDLLYELEKAQKTENSSKILTNIYTLLGYHQSAYDIFKTIVNLNDKKQFKKKYILEQKAKSHGNSFVVKDIRKFRKKNIQSKLLLEDFNTDPKNKNTFITQKNIVVFNKIVKQNRFKICIDENHKFEDHSAKIIEYIYWLSNCKNELIEFYNAKLSKYTNDVANANWFDTIEVFSATITLGENEKLFADISGGDNFMSDHILDIETEDYKITEIRYDG